ncbi:helix-turn-helix domain-containing protein [Rhodopseudomonas sp. BAL398]|uniref:TetR/AcrR family transcriptional regulator n=1 Tax=Rhodopseudomonas sp. BAL398 TaxID=3034676 RepID=UPI00294A9D0F|nr:helix-turn-helix domain-containing protein [Rhodopseudomonas sp. BAL398]WOK17158.1 helix-turn-helix domain-containing protein [Rhodopseudomonas sp. BAL398]
MPTKTNRPRKIPRQARSRATVEVILDATALLLVDEGFEQTTTNRIAERAGVSIGSLYQYFPNREAVVGAVAQRVEAGISEPLWLGLSQKHESDLRSEITLGLRKSINRHASVLPLLQILLQLELAADGVGPDPPQAADHPQQLSQRPRRRTPEGFRRRGRQLRHSQYDWSGHRRRHHVAAGDAHQWRAGARTQFDAVILSDRRALNAPAAGCYRTPTSNE